MVIIGGKRIRVKRLCLSSRRLYGSILRNFFLCCILPDAGESSMALFGGFFIGICLLRSYCSGIRCFRSILLTALFLGQFSTQAGFSQCWHCTFKK